MKISKLYFLALVCLLLLSSSVIAQTFYDINTVQKIEITFKESNWDTMMDTAKLGSESYIMAQSVTINGIKLDSVGVKYKGNSTYNASQAKNPLHIELDTYKEQDYEGYTDIKLSNVAKDPSFLREVLSYSILRKYMDAPLSNYANVYINGTLKGLYVSSESVGKKFVKTHFYSKNNSFFKCNPIDGAGPTSTALPNLVYLGTDSASYSAAYELNSTYGWKDLIKLSYTLKNDIANIENVLDVDRALWMLAYSNATVNLDSYIGQFTQNYYLYKDDTGRFNSVMWDFNEGFGTFSMTGTLNYSNTTAKSQMTHLLHAGDANWPLVQKLLAVPGYKKMYLAHLYTIISENFANGSYKTTAQSYQPIINASVQADPNKFFTYAQYQSNLTTDISGFGGPGGSSAPGITNLMDARSTYLLAQSDFTSTRPTIANITASNMNPSQNSTIYITANVTNANTTAVYLGYRSNVEAKFTKVLMTDNGSQGDGANGDKIYGAAIIANGATIQYYIYAENDNAGIFSPVRAEHEFYNIPVKSIKSDIVINELYSRGTSANPDWVEVYNTTAASIDLSGYKIYDSGGQSAAKIKKEFPAGTVIPANGYVVIVTDDAAESGFGLSNSGEKIWLENVMGTVIDSITFVTHTATQSYGRISDGGSWQLIDYITRGQSNGNNTAVDEVKLAGNALELKNYPNPFGTSTTIAFTLTSASKVVLTIFDMWGREVAILLNENMQAGNYTKQWNVGAMPNGVYFSRLQTEFGIANKQLIHLK